MSARRTDAVSTIPCTNMGSVLMDLLAVFGRDHRDAGVDRAQELALRPAVDPIGESDQPLMQAPPELDAAGDC